MRHRLAQSLFVWLYRYRGWVWGGFALLLLWASLRTTPTPISPWLRYLGTPLLLSLGMALRVWARRYVGEHTRGHTAKAPVLVVRGPYTYVRHPLYVSNIVAGLGFVLWILPNAYGLGVWSCYTMLHAALAVGEDNVLRTRFPLLHDAWSHKVGALWPRRSPKASLLRRTQTNVEVGTQDSAPTPRSIGLALLADRWTWIWWALLLGLGFGSFH